MAKKVILDVDPGIDDAMALCMALFNPRLEVVAVTATGGNVPPQLATRNVQAIIEHLDPDRLPRLGAACEPDYGRPVYKPADRSTMSLTRKITECRLESRSTC